MEILGQDPPESSHLGSLRGALESLAPSVTSLCESEELRELTRQAARRGYFRPSEEEELRSWFARALTVREGLWETIHEASSKLGGGLRDPLERLDLRVFVAGYAAACLLVRLDFFIVEGLAGDSRTRRKLNEPSARFRIPPKQFTAFYKSLANPSTALLLYRAMRFAEAHRASFASLEEDPLLGDWVERLPQLEEALDPSRRNFFERLLSYRQHSIRRRGASAREKLQFSLLESSGRLVAKLRNRWKDRRLDPSSRSRLVALLQPGDVLITRKDQALSNLFLPGYWPHAALYVGSEAERERWEIAASEGRRRRWAGEVRVLEALRDGVRFRSLETTLDADAVAVIRPRLAPRQVAEAIGRAVAHEGKLYNFDFDFFRSDRLVCTEVVYRGFDGVGELHLPLTERSGRLTLSAEDLLGLALEGRGFSPVAVFGAPGAPERLLTAQAAHRALAESLEPEGSGQS